MLPEPLGRRHEVSSHNAGRTVKMSIGRGEEGIMLGSQSQLSIKQHGIEARGQMLVQSGVKEERVKTRR